MIYVDYGNRAIIDCEHLKQYDDQFSYLPYQAVRLQFVNIEAVDSTDDVQKNKAVSELMNMCYQRMMRLDIVQNSGVDQVLVRVYDENGFDIGEMMIRKRLAARKEAPGFI